MFKQFTITTMVIATCSIGFTQQQKMDQGKMVIYENTYFKETIKKSLDDAETKKPKRKVFKMDVSDLDAPKSVDEFKTVWCNDTLSQGWTGTCWCFPTSSFYESEIFRLTKKEVKLSELFTVYWEYVEKAQEYMRTRGESFFGEGSETNAVARMMKRYGVVPAAAYAGKGEERPFHDHRGMYKEMKTYLESLKATSAWDTEQGLATVKSILNHHLGEPPTEVNVDGKKMSPLEYMASVKITPSDYVNFMSLKQEPYNSKTEYDVPDNWWNSEDYYNVPLDDFVDAVKTAVKSGYSLSIGGDVSETGYSPANDIAVIPSYDIPSEYIDENARQLRFSNGSTTDDHAIHLVGYTDKDNGTWFLIKDSGSGSRNGKNKGYYFYHEDYLKLKIMTFTVHRDAVKKYIARVD